jgi:hypothetical protein
VSTPEQRYDPGLARFVLEGQNPAPDEARVGDTRAFVRLWDVDAELNGPPPLNLKTAPVNGWQRGVLYRGATPALKLTWYGPMWDPSKKGDYRTEL